MVINEKRILAESSVILSSKHIYEFPEQYDPTTTIYIWGKKSVRFWDEVENENNPSDSETRINHKNCAQKPDLRENSFLGSAKTIRQLSGDIPIHSETSDYKNSNRFESDAATAFRKQNLESEPIIITSLGNIKIVEAKCGLSHLLLLSDQGRVFSFGIGEQGQLGLGPNVFFVQKPTEIKILPTVTQIGAGSNHSVALTKEGFLYSWGNAENVGVNLVTDSNFPVKLDNKYFSGKRVLLISAGYDRTMALNEKNELHVWGRTCSECYHATPKHFHSFPTTCRVNQICIGERFSMALLESGIVYSWGSSTYCETGRLRSTLWRERDSVSARINNPTELELIDSLGNPITKIVQISTGRRHTLLLTEEGKVYCFGENIYGQCGVPTKITRLRTPRAVGTKIGNVNIPMEFVVAGRRHSGAFTESGKLFMWGCASDHQLVHTASSESFLGYKLGVVPGQMGVSVPADTNNCFYQPNLIYSLINKKISTVCLGADFTVIIIGEGTLGSVGDVPR